MGGKSSGKNVLKNPFHNLLEKLLSAEPVPKIFISLIFGTKEIKDRGTLTHLATATKAQQIVEPLGPTGE